MNARNKLKTIDLMRIDTHAYCIPCAKNIHRVGMGSL